MLAQVEELMKPAVCMALVGGRGAVQIEGAILSIEDGQGMEQPDDVR